MRILILFFLFIGCLKICWAQPSDDICICELENTTAFSYFDSNVQTAVEYPTETIYSVFSFNTSWEEPEEVEIPTKESEKPIYGAIPDDNSLVAESGKVQDGEEAIPIAETEPIIEEEPVKKESVEGPIADVEPTSQQDIGSGGGAAPQRKTRVAASASKKRYAGKTSLKTRRKGKRLMRKKKPRAKKYKGKCPSF